MFVKINPNLGSNSQPLNKMINVMRAIKAVATAPAGSTPTCNVITNPAGSYEANQMITVISNTEAGGWSLAGNNNILDANTYSDSFGNTYQLALYNDSGKATYPYKMFVYRTNPSYPPNSSWTNYPVATVHYGCSNSTTAFESGSSFGSNYTTGEGTTSTMLYDVGNSWTTTQVSQSYVQNRPMDTTSTNNGYFPMGYYYGEFYMAATSDYLIFLQGNSSLTYCGTRYTQGWENDYSDNPPLVGLFYTRFNHPQSVWGWTRYMNTSNTAVQGPTAVYHKINQFYSETTSYSNTTYHPLHPISGITRYQGSSSYTTQYADRHAARMFTYSSGISYTHPAAMWFSSNHVANNNHIYNGQIGSTQWSNQGAPYAPIYDSSLGLLVPPAIPIMYQFYGTNFNGGGRLKGIYKSLNGANSFLSQYSSIDQDFNVPNDSGGNDQYRIVNLHCNTTAANNNLEQFLIRKA